MSLKQKKNILVLGAAGMLGNAIMRFFSENDDYEIYGSVRSINPSSLFPKHLYNKVIQGIDVENTDDLIKLFNQVRPDVVINCIGIVKQLSAAEDPLKAIPINSLLPHKLAKLCELSGSRFIHMSTDCIFSGKKGAYIESDQSDADDLYGRSKYLGEVDYQNAVTLRTSIIGHEMYGARSLVNWFLSQHGSVNGYVNAIFSGLPTVEVARVICDFVIPNSELVGLYHLSAEPINKFDLLSLISKTYGKDIEIIPNLDVCIDRSLDSTKFRNLTGYEPRSWPELIKYMHSFL